MASKQKKAGLQNNDVLDQINSLQAYLEKMKKRVLNGEISNTDTKNALQNLNVNLKNTDVLNPKRRKIASRKESNSEESADYGAGGDSSRFETEADVEKEMEERITKMKQLLKGESGSVDRSQSTNWEYEQYIKVLQMRHSKKFQCKECCRTFVHREKAEKHIETEHLDDSSDAGPIRAAIKDDRSTKKNKLKDKEFSENKASNFENEDGKRGKTKLETNIETRKNSHEKKIRRVAEKASRTKPADHQANRTFEKGILSCKLCNETFLEEYMLLEHETVKHWTCVACEVQFLHEDSWKDHEKQCQRSKTSRGRPNKSEMDKNENVFRPSFQSYQKAEKFLRFASVCLGSENTKRRMTCTVCNAKYETLTQLKKHIQGMHTHEKEHLCNGCGKGFSEESKLLYHTTNTCSKEARGPHASNIDGAETMPPSVEEEGSDDLEQRSKDENLYDEIDEQKVEEGDGDETEVIFNITFDKEVGQLHSTGDEELVASLVDVDTRMCTLCNMAFMFGFQRRQHMSSCHWGCFTCGVQFLHEEAYQSHVTNCNVAGQVQKGEYAEIKLRRTYESEDDFFKYIVIKYKEVDKKKQARMECLICGKDYFGQMAKMMRHIKSVHTKQCDCICHTCSKPFADKDNFVKHIKKCTGKPWVAKRLQSRTIPLSTVIETVQEDVNTTWDCSQCSETFSDDYLFREHMSTMHWGCGTCLWQFLDEKAFQEHAENCEDFKSPEDSEMIMPETDLIPFKSDRLFFQHVKMRVLKHATSGKTRTFECGHPHCQTSEHDHQTLFQLRKHIQYRHETKELKYQCTKCGTGFVDKFSLWKHDSKCSEYGEKIVISKLLGRIKPATGDAAFQEEAVVVKRECTECEEGFLYDHNYREHMAMKHWCCKPCKLQFLSQLAYDEHKAKCERPILGRSLSLPKVNLKLYRSDQKFFDFAQINFANRNKRLYQCTQCGDHNHGNLVKLKRHITSRHTKELTEKCVVCEKGFRDKRALLKHASGHLASGSAVLDVPENELAANLARIQEYVQKYSLTPVTGNQKACGKHLLCEEGCDLRFADAISHLTHMAEQHYSCQFCKMPFRAKAYQLTHEAICTQNKNGEADPNANDKSACEPKETSSVKPLNHRRRESLDFMVEHGISYEDGRLNCYGCRRCGKAFKDIAKIKRHVLGHHLKVSEHICNTCGKGFYEKKAMISHEKVHKTQSERGYITCQVCGLQLMADVPNSLKNHMTKHTGEKPYLCHLCPMAFRAKNTLQTHINGVHLMKKDHQCPHCTFSCTSKGRLGVHMRIHTGEKPYKCDTCGETFREKGMLRNHKMIHSGYKTVHCDICGQGFIKKVHYTSHMLNTHCLKVLETDPKVQSFMPHTPIQIQRTDTGTTYQIVSNVEDEVEVVTDATDLVDGAEYETVRIISGDQVTEHAYIVMINGEDDVAYTYTE